MVLHFYKSQSTVMPDLLDTTSSKKVVYIRQNVVEKDEIDELTGENHTYYEYEEAKLTKAEYEQYLTEVNTNETLETIEALKVENAMLIGQVDILTECLLEISELLYV